MSNTIKLQSVAVPALSFTVNELGENIGAYWQGTPPDTLARENIEAREAGLYFDGAGVLDLTKWLAIFKQRQFERMAQNNLVNDIVAKARQAVTYPEHALLEPEPNGQGGLRLINRVSDENAAFSWKEALQAWESAGGVQLTKGGSYLSKWSGDDCPHIIDDVKAHVEARNTALGKLGYEAAESELMRLDDLVWYAIKAVCYAPARTLAELADKADIVTEFASPRHGINGHEGPVLASLALDIKTLTNPAVIDLDARQDEIIDVCDLADVPLSWIAPYLKGKPDNYATQLLKGLKSYADKVAPDSIEGKRIAKVKEAANA